MERTDNDRKNGGKEQGHHNPGRTREQWREQKLRKAVEDGFDVISRRTLDAGDYIGLLNSHDYLMLQLRMSFGRRPEITASSVELMIERSKAVKAELNALNGELARLLGKKYIAPRGFRERPQAVAAD